MLHEAARHIDAVLHEAARHLDAVLHGARVMRIDAHQHFWRYDADRDTWITGEMAALKRDFLPDELAGHLTAHGFDGCIAVEAAPSMAQTRYLLDLARAHPFIRGVVGWVDLLAPDLARDLALLSREPMLRGVRHAAQGEADDFLARDDVIHGIGQLGAFGFTYDILIYAHQLPAAETLVSRLPSQPFVVDHLAKPRIKGGILAPWASRLRALAQHPNVCCKLSGLVTEADWTRWRPEHLRPYLDVALDAFGADRVMFGSDWPVCLVAADYATVVDVVEDYAAALTESERRAVFGGNAARFYHLDAGPVVSGGQARA